MGVLPGGWPSSTSVPSQLETRQLGNQCDAGLRTELRAWVHLVGSCEAWRQWVSIAGLFISPASSGGHRGISQVLSDHGPHVPADSSSSALEPLGCVAHQAAHPLSPLKTSMCFTLTFYQMEGEMSPVYHVNVLREESYKIIIQKTQEC